MADFHGWRHAAALARKTNELFYLAPGVRLGAYEVVALLGAGFYVSGVTQGRTYDSSPDGQRFLMIKQSGGDQGTNPPQIIVVQHWFEELKRLVPTP